MYTHLKDEQYYIDLYDRQTVDSCRDLIRIGQKVSDDVKNEKGLSDDDLEKAKAYSIELALYFETGRRYEEKAETIRCWIEKDRLRDLKIKNAVLPRGIRCLKCGAGMEHDTVTLHSNYRTNEERVLIFYNCPNKCVPGRAFYEGGEEYLIKPTLCESCGKPTDELKTTIKNEDIIITKYKCPQCNHKQTDTHDLSLEIKAEDPNFEVDRKRFCLSREDGLANSSWMSGLQQLKQIHEEQDQHEKDKEIYEEATELNKLTVFQMQELIQKGLEKAGFTSIQFEKPEISREIKVGFYIQDTKPERLEFDSKRDAKRAIEECLGKTNWRLMSAGISYRMGYLEGSLKGFDKEEDLLKLTQAYMKKYPKESVNL